jgi:hypothetical protein
MHIDAPAGYYILNIWSTVRNDQSFPFWFGTTKADMEAAASEADKVIAGQ